MDGSQAKGFEGGKSDYLVAGWVGVEILFLVVSSCHGVLRCSA